MGPTAKNIVPLPFALTEIAKAYRDMKEEEQYWENKYTHYEENRWFIPYANRPFTQGPIIQPDKPKNDDLLPDELFTI